MKKLITATTLGLALSFSSLSLASDYMNLYTKPVVESEVKEQISGGKVEKDFTSFYTTPKAVNSTASLSGESDPDDEDSYIVFGVRVPLHLGS